MADWYKEFERSFSRGERDDYLLLAKASGQPQRFATALENVANQTLLRDVEEGRVVGKGRRAIGRELQPELGLTRDELKSFRAGMRKLAGQARRFLDSLPAKAAVMESSGIGYSKEEHSQVSDFSRLPEILGQFEDWSEMVIRSTEGGSQKKIREAFRAVAAFFPKPRPVSRQGFTVEKLARVLSARYRFLVGASTGARSGENEGPDRFTADSLRRLV